MGCNSKKLAHLEQQNDSLRNELKARAILNDKLQEVYVLLDSIDINRKLLRSELQAAPSVEEFAKRLADINDYVKRSEKKIASMEKQLRSSRNEASAYTMMVDALKGEVVIRDGEVVQLTSAVSDYQTANRTLLDSVKYHESKANDMNMSVTEKEKQLAALESKVHLLENDFKLTEAEVYYARARLLEETARRTRLAPQKRKQTFTEALELYRKAYILGKEEANENIKALEGTLPTASGTVSSNQASLNE